MQNGIRKIQFTQAGAGAQIVFRLNKFYFSSNAVLKSISKKKFLKGRKLNNQALVNQKERYHQNDSREKNKMENTSILKEHATTHSLKVGSDVDPESTYQSNNIQKQKIRFRLEEKNSVPERSNYNANPGMYSIKTPKFSISKSSPQFQ